MIDFHKSTCVSKSFWWRRDAAGEGGGSRSSVAGPPAPVFIRLPATTTKLNSDPDYADNADPDPSLLSESKYGPGYESQPENAVNM